MKKLLVICMVVLFSVVFMLSTSSAKNCYLDNDCDGSGDYNSYLSICECPDGYVETFGDCDDTDTYINPNAVEVLDGVDNDCDGGVDELCGDLDGDLDIDNDDYNLFIAAYGSSLGDINFNPDADFDDDCSITINDYRILRSLI